MQIFIHSFLIFRKVFGLNEMNWQAPSMWEPVCRPSLGIENTSSIYSFLIGLPATIPILSSVQWQLE